MQCPAPTNCTKAQTNVCDGCAVCQRGLAPALTGDNRGQCAACTGGQATAVCNAYTNLGTSCACATCNNRYQLVLGSCAECTNNPNCETFRSNSCDCSICRVGHTGLNCAEVGAGTPLLAAKLLLLVHCRFKLHKSHAVWVACL